MEIYKLMEIAQEKVRERLTTNQYTDNWQWNERCFQFEVLETTESYEESYGTFRFCYDSEDVFERTAEEQLLDWINEWF